MINLSQADITKQLLFNKIITNYGRKFEVDLALPTFSLKSKKWCRRRVWRADND